MAQKLRDAFAEHWLSQARRWIGDSRDDKIWSHVSSNPIITPSVLRAHPELPWQNFALVFNESMTWDVFLERIETLNQLGSLRYLSEHPCMDPERARQAPREVWGNWDWVEIYSSPRMTLDRLEAVCRQASQPRLARHYILACGSANVPFAYILAHPEVPWNLSRRSAHDPHIQQHVQQAPGLAWDLSAMSENPHISLDFVQRTGYVVDVLQVDCVFGPDGTVIEHQAMPLLQQGEWDWVGLSANPCMTLDDLAREELPWEWAQVSMNPNLTWDFVMERLHYAWRWESLSANLPLERILADGTAHPWSDVGLSQHPQLGWDTVAAHPERQWNTAMLLSNTMPHYQERWMAATARTWCAARRLQRFARDVTCNPVFAAARRIRSAAVADAPA